MAAWIGLGFYFDHRRNRPPKIDVAALQLGVDWRARRELQAMLTRLGKSGATSSQTGLAYLLHNTVAALRRAELSWLYAAVENHRAMRADKAEGIFRQLAVKARARFQTELLRAADGVTVTQRTPEMRARPEEGEGVVVVTLIVAAKREIVDVARIDDAAQLEALLDDLVYVAEPELIAAIEVIWSPSAEDDRMSTAELEMLYPELRKIDEASIAGRVFCEYCAAPFAAELRKCSHCGAPLAGQKG